MWKIWKPCALGWVDIGTVARVPLNVLVYLSKIMENNREFFFKVIASALVTTYWVRLYSTLHQGGNIFFTMWTLWASKNAEFYVEFKSINFP
jgi:hypothetical protein